MENSPDFHSFVVKLDDRQSEIAANEVIWTLSPGLHKLSARVKTQQGWLGPESWVKIYNKQDWLKNIFAH